MIISLNWLKKYVEIDVPVEELVKLIGARLVEVEQVIDLGCKYSDVLVVKVVDVAKIEGSDHLSLVKIDDCGVKDGITRDDNGLIQVVCGAPNIKNGLLVAWLPPESIVPNTFNTSEQFNLDTRNIRGIASNGMIASAKELDISDDHEGILEINDDIEPGTSFAVAYELNDFLLDIENKSLTNRPDCFGIIGFAREVSAILGKKFKNPDWFLQNSIKDNDHSLSEIVNVKIDDPNLSFRYLLALIGDLDVLKKSKSQLINQTYLSRMGVRPINAIVDVTNYMMLLTGQPLHAFDYDKLLSLGDGRVEIRVRSAKVGEKLVLLDGKEIELSVDDIVISTKDTAIALAGAMGGLSTAIDDSTKRIVIESASFNLYKLRATQMRHGIFSEAITRFTKGQPTALTGPVLLQALQMICSLSGSECKNEIFEDYPVIQQPVNINLDIEKTNSILGSHFSQENVCEVLANAGFILDKSSSNIISVSVPFWRSDIHIQEDIIEELGRITGFDNIKPTLPVRESRAISPSEFDLFKSKVRRILINAGSNEILSYSFVNGDVLRKVGQDINNSYRIVNSISPNLQYYRQTLTPSLLIAAYTNTKNGFGNFSLFEFGKTHEKTNGLNDEGVPNETESAAITITSIKSQSGAAYYRAKRMFDYLCERLGLVVSYISIDHNVNDSVSSLFEQRRSASIISESGSRIGVVGEYKLSIIDNLKLPKYSAGFEIDMSVLFDAMKNIKSSYIPISKYPSTDRDICFKVDNSVWYDHMIQAINNNSKMLNYTQNVSLVDIYRAQDSGTKNITIHVKITPTDSTLTGLEITGIIDNICNSVSKATNATVI